MQDCLVLCVRLVDDADPVTGSIAGQCHRCQVPVWLAPSTLTMTARHKLLPVCQSCLEPQEFAAMVMALRAGPAPQQADELVADVLRRDP